jgi:hypothetical protein
MVEVEAKLPFQPCLRRAALRPVEAEARRRRPSQVPCWRTPGRYASVGSNPIPKSVSNRETTMITVKDLFQKRKGSKGVGEMAAKANPRHGFGQRVLAWDLPPIEHQTSTPQPWPRERVQGEIGANPGDYSKYQLLQSLAHVLTKPFGPDASHIIRCGWCLVWDSVHHVSAFLVGCAPLLV